MPGVPAFQTFVNYHVPSHTTRKYPLLLSSALLHNPNNPSSCSNPKAAAGFRISFLRILLQDLLSSFLSPEISSATSELSFVYKFNSCQHTLLHNVLKFPHPPIEDNKAVKRMSGGRIFLRHSLLTNISHYICARGGEPAKHSGLH